MRLFVGLGNPGKKYSQNRHNVGFMALGEYVARHGLGGGKAQFQGECWKATVGGEDVLLLKPDTFMNRSGNAVREAMRFYKLSLEDVTVIHDELDLPFSAIRIKQGGGLAGHNGLRSISQQCGGQDFSRIRVGIGRPDRITVENYVLSNFDAAERDSLGAVLDLIGELIDTISKDGVQIAMNRFNKRAM